MVKFQGKHYIQRHSTVRIDIISHDYNSVEKGKKWEEFQDGLTDDQLFELCFADGESLKDIFFLIGKIVIKKKNVSGISVKNRGNLGIMMTSQSFQSPTLCDPMDCSMAGFPVHQLPEPTQTHVYQVGDAIQPSHPLLSPSPAFTLYRHQGLFH